MRDNQQAKLYRAEQAWARAQRAVYPEFFKFGRTEVELRDYVIGLAPVAKKLGLVKQVADARPKVIEVRDKLSKASWAGEYNSATESIRFKKGTGTSYRMAVHELTHHLTTDLVPSHGAEFARNHLQLINALLGADAAKALEEAYDAEKVIFRTNHQQAAAWKQIIRMRSDNPRGKKNVPVRTVVVDLEETKLADWAEVVQTAKFSHGLGQLRGVSSFIARSSHAPKNDSDAPQITFIVAGGHELTVYRHALRYVEGPMVRAR